jgi:hypothetical protein
MTRKISPRLSRPLNFLGYRVRFRVQVKPTDQLSLFRLNPNKKKKKMAAGFAVPTFDPRAAGSSFGDGGFYTGGYAGPAMAPPAPLSGSIETGQGGYFAPQTYSTQQGQASLLTGGFEDEPPLLEELGINFEHIYRKTFAVLIPFSKIDSSLHINDDDLAGPFFFGFIFGVFLLLVRSTTFFFIVFFPCSFVFSKQRHQFFFSRVSHLGGLVSFSPERCISELSMD